MHLIRKNKQTNKQNKPKQNHEDCHHWAQNTVTKYFGTELN